MRLKLSPIWLYLMVLGFACYSLSSYGQALKADSIQSQLKSDTTKLVKATNAATAAGGVMPMHTHYSLSEAGSLASVGAFENRDKFYFKDRRDAKSDIFYADAPIYVEKNEKVVGGQTQTDVSMLVLGTMFFAENAQVVQQGETSLTGDFVSVVTDPDLTPAKKELFVEEIEDAAVNNGVVNFIGKWNKQVIKRETYGQQNNPEGKREEELAVYTVPKDEDKLKKVLNFPTINVEKEGVLKQAGDGDLDAMVERITSKANIQATDLVDEDVDLLPTYDFAHMGYVAAGSNVAMSVKKLDITGGNRFSAEMATEGLYKNSQAGVAGGGILDAAAAADFYKLNSAYLDIDELIDGNGKDGYSEVAMKLYRYSRDTDGSPVDNASTDTEVKRTNSFKVNVNIPSAGGALGEKDATFLRGITSPFNSLMRADYMLYHLLTKPGKEGVTGDLGEPIGPPETKILSGHGYLFAMDASRAKFENIKENWHVPGAEGAQAQYIHEDPQQLREKGGYFFSRVLREIKYDTKYYSSLMLWRNADKYDNYNFFSTLDENGEKKYEPQRFNVGDVVVRLEGYGDGKIQFLANPYMTPITLRQLLGREDASGNIDASTATDANKPYSVGSTGVEAVHDLMGAVITPEVALVRSKYWVVNTGLVTTVGSPLDEETLYAYNIKYDVVDLANSASTVENPESRMIEPLQVFALQVANPGDFTFTNDMKVLRGKNKERTFSRFPISLVKHVEDINNLPVASASAGTRSSVSETETTTIPDWFVMEAVARDKQGEIVAITADRAAVRFYDTATEGFERLHDVRKTLVAENSQKESGDITALTPTNVLYTTTAVGDPLLSNGVSYKVKEIPLHYLPGSESEDVVLYFKGLDGFEKINNVWLVDNFTGFEDKLYDEYEYTFKSDPNESYVGSKNRFTLVFDRDDERPSLTENPITCYYSGSILHIGGLNEKDLGSKVFIYDLQGRLMGSTIINNYPGMEYHKSLGQGTFIVKIVGNRNFDTKFVNLKNY